MNIRRVTVGTVGAVALAAATLAAGGAARGQKLQQAIDLIESKGDIAHAIPLLQEAAKSSDKATAAQALLYLGRAQERTDKAQARQTYERIVSEFSGQPAAASQARARLAALGDGAGVASERRILAHVGELKYPSLVNGDRTILFSLPGPGSSAFLDIASGVVRHINGTGSESGGDCSWPALSPDGKQIACTWQGSGKNGRLELRVLPTAGNGTKARTLISDGADVDYFRPIAWTHDGASLFVELEKKDRTWSFARMNVADGRYDVLKSVDRRRTMTTGMRVRLSPDGRYLAYAALTTNPPPNVNFDTLDKHIYLLALEGSAETDVAPADGINENPVWTRDGSHVIFVSNRSGSFDLWAVPVSNGKPTAPAFIVRRNIGRGADGFAITNSGDYYYAPSAPSIPTLAISELTRQPRGGASSAGLPADLIGMSPSWSPDGKKIAFQRPKPGRGNGNDQDLVIRILSTGDERRYSVPSGQWIDGPLWFHDSQALLVRVVNPGAAIGTNQALYRADLRTGSLTEVTTLGRFMIYGGVSGALAADDNTLYMMGPLAREGARPTGPPDRIIRADLRTGKTETVFTATPARTLIPGVSLSPDGRTLAFMFYPSTQSLDSDTPLLRLARVGIDGTGFRELAGPFLGWGAGSPATWTGDGRSLLFAPHAKGDLERILRIDAETGATEATGLEVEGLMAFSPSPDGSRVVVGRQAPATTELRSLDHLQAVIKAHK